MFKTIFIRLRRLALHKKFRFYCCGWMISWTTRLLKWGNVTRIVHELMIKNGLLFCKNYLIIIDENF